MPQLSISAELQWAIGIGITVGSAFLGAVWQLVGGAVRRMDATGDQMAAALRAHISVSDEEQEDLRAAMAELSRTVTALAGRVGAVEVGREVLARKEDVHRLEVELARAVSTFQGLDRLVSVNSETARRLEQWLMEQGR